MLVVLAIPLYALAPISLWFTIAGCFFLLTASILGANATEKKEPPLPEDQEDKIKDVEQYEP